MVGPSNDTTPRTAVAGAGSEVPWWKQAVFYQIYPRSFFSAGSSGVGDLRGIESRLNYLLWLGVDALWISPFFKSPMADFGYDVSDYCDVEPLFGSLEDFDALLTACHARGLRMIIDWVPGHTSDQHSWFREARRSRDDPKRDWYVWRDPGPGGELPNNWTAALAGQPPAWMLDPQTNQLYLHSYLAAQPDLNWANAQLRDEMHKTLRFWLDRGVDGFRADAIHNIGKHPELPDVDPKLAQIPHCALNDEAVTHEYLREIRRLIDGYSGERMVVGEVFLPTIPQVAAYYGNPKEGQGDGLHLCFNFPPLFADWRADAWHDCIGQTYAALDPRGAWPTWVLSNHDQKRHSTRYGGHARARAAAILLLGLRGTPFLYMGEELGLEDADVPRDRAIDPGGRDGCRAPIPWQPGGNRGWGAEPWLPWPPDADARSVEAQRGDPAGMLHLYRDLLRARRVSPALCRGDQRFLATPEGVLAWERRCGDDRRAVLVNFSAQSVAVSVGEAAIVEVASDRQAEGEPYVGKLAPEQAMIVRFGGQ